MNPRNTGITTIAALLLAALMVFVLPVGLAAGAATPGGAGTSQTIWAYGAARTYSFSGTTSDGWAYIGQATYGYSTILNQTNTSANGSTFELSVSRVMGALFTIELCTPKCSDPVDTANFTYHAWETDGAWANFTTTGSVTEGTSTVSAIALSDSHTSTQGNLVETSVSDLAGVLRSNSLTANVTTNADVNFTTPLGLIPVNLSTQTSQTWNSTSAFVAAGASNWTYTATSVAPLRNITIGPVSGSTTVSGSGSVSVDGRFTVGNTVTLDGVTFPAIVLTVHGPFSVREGVIFVPSTSDLFNGAAQPWAANQSGGATAQMSYLDALPSAGGHLGLGGSLWSYASTSVNPGDTLSLLPSGGATESAAATPPAVPPATVQGEPQSPSQAEGTQNCLVSGSACPAATTAPGGPAPGHFPRGLIGLAILGTIAAVLIAAVVVVAERRRMPPPIYPNAGLYPPGGSGPLPRAPGARSPDDPPPADDDPLSHLW